MAGNGDTLEVRATEPLSNKVPTNTKMNDLDNIQMLCNKTGCFQRRLRSVVRMMKFSKQHAGMQEIELFMCTCERNLSSLFQVVS